MGWKHFSSTVLSSSRWSVQCTPTGHELFLLCSSLADGREESRRKLLSWSSRAHGVTPPMAFTATGPGQHACYKREKHQYHLEALQITQWRAYFNLWEMFAYANEMNLLFQDKQQMWQFGYEASHQAQKGLCSHVINIGLLVGRQCTSADVCWQTSD